MALIKKKEVRVRRNTAEGAGSPAGAGDLNIHIEIYIYLCVCLDSVAHVFVPVCSGSPGQGWVQGAVDVPEGGRGSPRPVPAPQSRGPGRQRGGSRQMEHKARNRAGERAGGEGGAAKLPGPLIHKIHKSSGMNNNRKKQ